MKTNTLTQWMVDAWKTYKIKCTAFEKQHRIAFWAGISAMLILCVPVLEFDFLKPLHISDFTIIMCCFGFVWCLGFLIGGYWSAKPIIVALLCISTAFGNLRAQSNSTIQMETLDSSALFEPFYFHPGEPGIEPASSLSQAVALGCVVLLIGGVFYYKVVPLLKKWFGPTPQNTNSTTEEFSAAVSPMYGACYIDGQFAYCLGIASLNAASVFPNTPTTAISLLTTIDRISISSIAPQETLLDVGGFKSYLLRLGLDWKAGIRFSKNNRACQESETPIRWNGSGFDFGPIDSPVRFIESTRDMVRWTTIAKMRVPMDMPIVVQSDEGNEPTFYRVRTE